MEGGDASHDETNEQTPLLVVDGGEARTRPPARRRHVRTRSFAKTSELWGNIWGVTILVSSGIGGLIIAASCATLR